MLKELGHPGDHRDRADARTAATSRPIRRASRRSITRSRTSRRSTSTSTARRSSRARRELPAMDRGALALQVNEGHPKLVHLPDPPASESVTAKKVEATIGADGSATIDWRTDVTGVVGELVARALPRGAHASSACRRTSAPSFAGLAVDKVEASDLEDLEKPVSLHVPARRSRVRAARGETRSHPRGSRASTWSASSRRSPSASSTCGFTRRARPRATGRCSARRACTRERAPRAEDVRAPFGSVQSRRRPSGEHGARGDDRHPRSRRASPRQTTPRSARGARQVDHALGQRLVVAPMR